MQQVVFVTRLYARIGNNDVKTAKGFDRRVGRRSDRCLFAHVRNQWQSAGGQCPEGRGVNVDKSDLSTFLEEPLADGEPDAVSGSGDKCATTAQARFPICHGQCLPFVIIWRLACCRSRSCW